MGESQSYVGELFFPTREALERGVAALEVEGCVLSRDRGLAIQHLRVGIDYKVYASAGSYHATLGALFAALEHAPLARVECRFAADEAEVFGAGRAPPGVPLRSSSRTFRSQPIRSGDRTTLVLYAAKETPSERTPSFVVASIEPSAFRRFNFPAPEMLETTTLDVARMLHEVLLDPAVDTRRKEPFVEAFAWVLAVREPTMLVQLEPSECAGDGTAHLRSYDEPEQEPEYSDDDTKLDAARELLAEGNVCIFLDPAVEGVELPKHLFVLDEVKLVVGRNVAVPIPDLQIDEQGVRATLTFQRPFLCVIPWAAVTALTNEDLEGYAYRH
jgi:hypothetical protein